MPTGATVNAICADFDRLDEGNKISGYSRIGLGDLMILVAHWGIKEPVVGPGIPSCFITGDYHYMIDP